MKDAPAGIPFRTVLKLGRSLMSPRHTRQHSPLSWALALAGSAPPVATQRSKGMLSKEGVFRVPLIHIYIYVYVYIRIYNMFQRYSSGCMGELTFISGLSKRAQ